MLWQNHKEDEWASEQDPCGYAYQPGRVGEVRAIKDDMEYCNRL